MAFDPFREAHSNFIGERDVVQVPIYIQIETAQTVRVVMVERIFDVINRAAIRADLETYSQFFCGRCGGVPL